ncbi:MAG TPA: hypothetical protein VN289_18985, partial [Paraburkholderia sp.]|nr:hypothetical protein [Paraburkholderia sp.]
SGAMAASDNAVNISVSFFIRFSPLTVASRCADAFFVRVWRGAGHARAVYKAENIRCAFN